jgi:hypothetical protein
VVAAGRGCTGRSMDHKLVAIADSPGWRWLEKDPPDVPGVVTRMVRCGRLPVRVSPETTREVRAWIGRVGWEPWSAPVRLVPLSR